MPSWQHRFHTGVLLPLSGARRRNALLELPEQLAASAAPPRLDPRHGALLDLQRRQHRGIPVWCLVPRATPPSAPVVVFVHGDAPVRGLQPAQLGYCADLALACGARVVVPLLPQLPGGTADVVVPALAALVRRVLDEHRRSRVVVVGEACGAGAALAALQLLAASGREQPDHLVLLSPWLDAAVPDRPTPTPRDPLLHVDQLRERGRLWAGHLPVDHPRVSPLHGCLRGLPEATAFTGTRDLLHHDSTRLAQRAQEVGAPVHLEVGEGLVHGWAVLTSTPEGAAATARVRALVSGPVAGSRSPARGLASSAV